MPGALLYGQKPALGKQLAHADRIDIAFDSRPSQGMTAETSSAGAGTGLSRVRVLIIGTGFSGLCAAIASGKPARTIWCCSNGRRLSADLARQHLSRLRLRCAGAPVLVFLRAEPGLEPHLRPRTRDLVLSRSLLRQYDLRRHIVFRQTVCEARFDPEDSTWHVRTQEGRRYQADFVIFGIGGLSNPTIPTIPGAEGFSGRQFHTATWDHSVDLSGKRVAVIGTGASAIQVVPAIAPRWPRWCCFSAPRPGSCRAWPATIARGARPCLRTCRQPCGSCAGSSIAYPKGSLRG